MGALSLMKRAIRKARYNYIYPENIDSDAIQLFWWNENKNIGDALNESLIGKISGKKIERVPANYGLDYYSAIGSVIQGGNDNVTIWGSGLISEKAKPIFKPKKVLAVRGPLTRARLMSMEVTCPEVYGDPALLISKYYQPSKPQKYKLGVIPHYVDKKHVFFKERLPEWVKVLDVETDDVQCFIDDLCSCELIVSSSLHGIIIADSYGIPSSRACFTGDVFGGDFKFLDYAMSVGRVNHEAYTVSTESAAELIGNLKFEVAKGVEVSGILNTCPFL